MRVGFVQSDVDECVFYCGSTIFVTYIDDGILLGPDKDEIQGIFDKLSKDFKLTDEGDLCEYLGVRHERTDKGEFKLTQPTLINRILETVQVSKVAHTPAIEKKLQKDLGGHEAEEDWDYRSVIGMLNFLCCSTRPDIAYAVSQCARFMANPRRSHELAVIRICQYLKKTEDKGMYMRPDGSDSFQVYADADYCGNYKP